MPATEHAPPPRPLPSPSPKDQSPSPRISHPEPLRPTQPTTLKVEPEQPEPSIVKTIEPTTKPLPEPTSVDKPETSSQAKLEESKLDEDEDEDEVDDDKSSGLELINMETFGQILELDEDEDSHDFSQPMVWEYFEQAEKTFSDMNEAHERKDLQALSQLGHFLKGSSAALGLARVQNSCEKIQHYGQLRDEVANKDLSPSEALDKTSKLLKRVKKEYNEAQVWLKDFYEVGAW
ncbi:hypothetical protein CVT25_015066 [Psilocybe cyanescens]|uniref:HPt domain-containing protein n=1 Tax=Psilocybe cyanescens TaxID=93625 RepID=A0A409WS03_PSICY|nr:hypothetical protein CVT25_015066 [Psilocybe cyanescens]